MSKTRLPDSARKGRRSLSKKLAPNEFLRPTTKALRFIGISLSGGKADKTALAIMEYFPEQKKLFLSRLLDKIKAEEFISADLKLYEILLQNAEGLVSVAFDAPLSLPKCSVCELECPGYELCTEAEVKWMRDRYLADQQKKKPKKYFTPYTQRCVDLWLGLLDKENLGVQHALGANAAPLTARARFLRRRLPYQCIEVWPKLSLWRIGQRYRLPKTDLKTYRNSAGGEEARRRIISQFAEKSGIFLYAQDQKLLAENFHCFDAFLSAYTAFLKHQGETEPKPMDFPANEAWVEVPT